MTSPGAGVGGTFEDNHMNAHSRFRRTLIAVVAGAAALSAGVSAALDAPPVAPIRPVTDRYFGTEVVDDYRYLENLSDPAVQAWMRAQASYTRSVLDALPGRAALLERIHELSNSDVQRGNFVRRGQRYFYEMSEPGAQQPKLYYRDGLAGEEHLLIDPAKAGATPTSHLSLDFFTPSWDGRYVAYGMSEGGSEESVLRVLEVASGKRLAEEIDRTSNSVIGWRPDNRSFFYLRYAKSGPDTPAAETLYNARSYLHTLGARTRGENDPVVFGRGVARGLKVPEGQGTYVVTAADSPYAIAVANHNMDNNPVTLYVAPLAKVHGASTPWRKLADVEDGVSQFELHRQSLYFLSQKGASRFRLLATPLTRPDVRRGQLVVAERAGVITGFALAKEGIYLRERDGAVSKLLLSSMDGKRLRALPLPYAGSLFGPVTDPLESGALFNMQSWVQAPRLFSYDPVSDVASDTGLIPPSKVDSSQLESREVLALSYDGTRIPLSIIYRKGLVLDGSHPTLLRGYGAYGSTAEARFTATSIAWIERGGVIAVAHIRGGGEYGEDWHRGGQKLSKPNTILDFIACGQYLVDSGYTASKRMAAQGGSAGGITVGGALTWRPDLFGVILDHVGMSDSLRAETEANGPPNIVEFGSTRTEEGFHGLYAMSAYAHVRAGTAYPAVLFTTGANDPRVSPWHMTKMAARVQAASTSGRPVLLRIDYDAGHGIGSNRSQREIETADVWSFALWQMGDQAFQPARDQAPAR